MSAVALVTPGAIRNATKKYRPSDFQKLRLRVAFSVDACAELCGVTAQIVEHWDVEGAPLIVMRLLHLYDRQDLSDHGPGWKGFKFSRGKLICGRLSFTPRNLRQVPHYVDVFNRLETAKLRFQDGLPLDQVLSIVFGSPAFQALPGPSDSVE